MRDMGMTDEMVTPPDETTMPTLKVGVIRPASTLLQFLAKELNSLKTKSTQMVVFSACRLSLSIERNLPKTLFNLRQTWLK